MRISPKSDDGFALMTVVIFSTALFLYMTSYFSIMYTDRATARTSQNLLKSEALAEAAVEEVLWEMNYSNSDFTGAEGWNDDAATVTRWKNNIALTDNTGNTIGTYIVSVRNWNTTAATVTVTGNLTGGGQGLQSVVGAQTQIRPLFSAAIKANGTVHLDSNAYTDSYNSAAQYGGANLFLNGDVVTNSTAAGLPSAISMDSNAQVGGDAATGTGGVISPTSRVTGTTTSDFSETLTSVDTLYQTQITALSLLANLGAVTLPNGTIIATDRHYDSISTTSNTTVTVNGNVSILLDIPGPGLALDLDSNTKFLVSPGSAFTVYTRGNIQLDSNSMIQSSLNNSNPALPSQGLAPTAVAIRGLSTCTSIDFDSNTNLSGTIYAPSALVQLDSNVDIYGSIVGNQVELDSNVGVHYDEALATSGPANGVKLQWYRKTN